MQTILSDGLKDLDEYLDRYCKGKGITKKDALEHKVVKGVGLHYGVTESDISSIYLPFISGDDGSLS